MADIAASQGVEVDDADLALGDDIIGRYEAGKSVAAVRWRVNSFDPLMERLAADFPGQRAVNRDADLLHHRYLMATAEGRDLDNIVAIAV